MSPVAETIDVTKAEGEIIVAYCLGRLKRDRHCNPKLDDVVYWRAEWMRPQPDACKRSAYETYRTALEAWRDERKITDMTTTPQPQPAPQKSAAHLAVEALSERVDNLALNQAAANQDILTAIRELQSEIGIVRGILTNLQQHTAQPAPATVTSGNGAQYTTFHADTLVMTYDDSGKPSYKVKGGRFSQFGVRVWPEVLPLLNIDPVLLKPGPNPINLTVKAELETKPGEDGQPTTKAKRIVGLA